jgi:hypothetical protein
MRFKITRQVYSLATLVAIGRACLIVEESMVESYLRAALNLVAGNLDQSQKKNNRFFIFFLDGFSLPAGQSTAPPKNGPGVSQARVPTHIRVGDDHAAAA